MYFILVVIVVENVSENIHNYNVRESRTDDYRSDCYGIRDIEKSTNHSIIFFLFIGDRDFKIFILFEVQYGFTTWTSFLFD